MGICEECLYFEVCNSWHKDLEEEGLITGGFFQHKCKDFKNKSDLQEVKHGEWKDTGIDELDLIYSGWKCSECGYIYCGDKSNYCPNCGAKMKVGV